MTVRVRIAPSPTGDPHVGTAYMALFNMIFARRHNGKFILRIEDTDQSRSRPEYETNIYKALKWCNIQWDEGPDCGGSYGPYRQSERLPIYQKYSDQLLQEGKAYKCFCTAEELAAMREDIRQKGGRQGYDRRCRNLSAEEVRQKEASGIPFTVRMKVPLEGECVCEDSIKGRITCPWADVDDQVIMKSDGFPTYHLAMVIDDHLMEITHVIRGDEWISSLPKHVLLYSLFGWKEPVWMHMPLLLGTDGKKLSKRRNPTSIFYYRDSGYLPEAFVNFLTLMGYSMPGDREIYSLSDIMSEFDAKRIGVSGAVFDVKKLDWIDQQYIINNIPQEKLWDRLKEWQFNDEFMNKLMPLVHARIKTFGDFMDVCDFFFINDLKLTPEKFHSDKVPLHVLSCMLQTIIWSLDAKEEWSGKALYEASQNVATVFGVHHKKILMRLLFLTFMGKLQGPPLFDSVDILGKDRMRVRLLGAIDTMGGISNKKIDQLKKCWDKQDCSSLLNDGKE